MKKIQPRIIKNNEASESNLREFYKEVIQFVVRINSLNTSNSKELQDFVGRTIYVWFYILLLSLFAQNFDFVQCLISDFDTLHKDNFENFLSLFYRYYIFMYVWLLLIIFYLNLYLLFYFYNYILYIRISFPNLFFFFKNYFYKFYF